MNPFEKKLDRIQRGEDKGLWTINMKYLQPDCNNQPRGGVERGTGATSGVLQLRT